MNRQDRMLYVVLFVPKYCADGGQDRKIAVVRLDPKKDPASMDGLVLRVLEGAEGVPLDGTGLLLPGIARESYPAGMRLYGMQRVLHGEKPARSDLPRKRVIQKERPESDEQADAPRMYEPTIAISRGGGAEPPLLVAGMRGRFNDDGEVARSMINSTRLISERP